MILNRKNILDAKDFDIHKVEVPKWGGEVCIRPFSVGLKDRIERMQNDPSFRGSVRAMSLAGSICDEKGELLFSEQDIELLSKKDLSTSDLVLLKILEINNISTQELEEDVKN